MRFKRGQRITYKCGMEGTILTTERKGNTRPIISVADDGDIWTHCPDGLRSAGGENPWDIVDVILPVPQGEGLVGLLCGMSDDSLESAREGAEYRAVYLSVIDDYLAGERYPYKAKDGGHWKYAWPVALEDMKKHLWDGNDENR